VLDDHFKILKKVFKLVCFASIGVSDGFFSLALGNDEGVFDTTPKR
jgi:hypothetical protein